MKTNGIDLYDSASALAVERLTKAYIADAAHLNLTKEQQTNAGIALANLLQHCQVSEDLSLYTVPMQTTVTLINMALPTLAAYVKEDAVKAIALCQTLNGYETAHNKA